MNYGAFRANESVALGRSGDKLRSMQLLAHKGSEAATKKDFAGMMIEFLEENARPHRVRTKGKG